MFAQLDWLRLDSDSTKELVFSLTLSSPNRGINGRCQAIHA